ncbi:MAG: Rrf2 family transcriptional regulator [Oscillospiraceae bacterium]|nr:Rrf2 family transcriptional regulator [Oscillospiraceae bacterium]
MISTKGRYALRVLVDLAEHQQEGYLPMKIVASRQGISLKYLEQITPILTRNGLIEGLHGKGGGYRLTKAPEQYRVGEILRLAEGDLAPVACLACDAKSCARAQDCRTLPMWKKYYEMTNAYFDGITVADLVKDAAAGDSI